MLQNMLCQVAFALRHGPEGGNPLTGRFYDEIKQLPRCLDPLDENLVFHNYLAKMTLYYEGWESSRRAKISGPQFKLPVC